MVVEIGKKVRVSQMSSTCVSKGTGGVGDKVARTNRKWKQTVVTVNSLLIGVIPSYHTHTLIVNDILIAG